MLVDIQPRPSVIIDSNSHRRIALRPNNTNMIPPAAADHAAVSVWDRNWFVGTGPVERLQFMLSNAEATGGDIRFIFGQDGEVVQAHSALLVLHVPRFYKDFCKNAIFSRRAGQKEVTLPPKFRLKAFKLALRSIYLQEIPEFNWNEEEALTDALELLAFSGDYMPMLNEHCQQGILQKIRDAAAYLDHFIKDALKILPQILELENKPIKDAVIGYLATNAQAVFKTPEFLKCSLKGLKELLKSDMIPTSEVSEVDIFNAACLWAKHQIRRQENSGARVAGDEWTQIGTVLEDAVYLIRFPLMLIEEFMTCGASDLVSAENRNQILAYSYLRSRGTKEEELNLPKNSTAPFSRLPRAPIRIKNEVDTPAAPIVEVTAHVSAASSEKNEVEKWSAPSRSGAGSRKNNVDRSSIPVLELEAKSKSKSCVNEADVAARWKLLELGKNCLIEQSNELKQKREEINFIFKSKVRALAETKRMQQGELTKMAGDVQQKLNVLKGIARARAGIVNANNYNI